MIEKMKVVHIVTTASEKTALLDRLRELGVIHFAEKADADQRQRLLDLLADHTMADEAKIQAVRNLYDDLHIADDCTEAINAYYAEARKALDSVALPQAQKAPLWEYAASLLGRTK